jgi:hypothetical protein
MKTQKERLKQLENQVEATQETFNKVRPELSNVLIASLDNDYDKEVLRRLKALEYKISGLLDEFFAITYDEIEEIEDREWEERINERIKN